MKIHSWPARRRMGGSASLTLLYRSRVGRRTVSLRMQSRSATRRVGGSASLTINAGHPQRRSSCKGSLRRREISERVSSPRIDPILSTLVGVGSARLSVSGSTRGKFQRATTSLQSDPAKSSVSGSARSLTNSNAPRPRRNQILPGHPLPAPRQVRQTPNPPRARRNQVLPNHPLRVVGVVYIINICIVCAHYNCVWKERGETCR